MRALALIVLIVLIAFIALVACTGDKRPVGPLQDRHGHHRDGDRVGVHGMVLFGRTHHYLEHIPTFTRPHDEQLVMRVTLTDAEGRRITDSFSDQTYTLQPTSKFSLDDLALKRRVEFRADVFRGNFEAGGARIRHDVRVTVDAVLVARNLPGVEPIARGDQEYLVFGEPGDAYLTNYIRDTRGFQQILRVDAIEGMSPSRVRRVTIRSAGRAPKAGTVRAPGVTIEIGAELSCLVAPDFAAPCPHLEPPPRQR